MSSDVTRVAQIGTSALGTLLRHNILTYLRPHQSHGPRHNAVDSRQSIVISLGGEKRKEVWHCCERSMSSSWGGIYVNLVL